MRRRLDSCSNIRSGDQFYNFLTHNFYRHFDQNRAPLGLFFHSSWLKNNPEFLDAFLYWIDEVLENHPEVYFITQTQVIQWIQDPVTKESAKNFLPWHLSTFTRSDQATVPPGASAPVLSSARWPSPAVHGAARAQV